MRNSALAFRIGQTPWANMFSFVGFGSVKHVVKVCFVDIFPEVLCRFGMISSTDCVLNPFCLVGENYIKVNLEVNLAKRISVDRSHYVFLRETRKCDHTLKKIDTKLDSARQQI